MLSKVNRINVAQIELDQSKNNFLSFQARGEAMLPGTQE